MRVKQLSLATGYAAGARRRVFKELRLSGPGTGLAGELPRIANRPVTTDSSTSREVRRSSRGKESGLPAISNRLEWGNDMGSTTFRTLASLATSLLVIYSLQILPEATGQTAGTDTSNPTEAAPQSVNQLQALVAPIALYPDSLVAQILTAATFPDQVAIANYWLQQNKSLTG